jgi:hypothetical protein
MSIVQRTRGIVLRLVRQRLLAVVVGLCLAAPAAWIEVADLTVPWWVQGLALVALATGIAIAWTGFAGLKPDWVEGSGGGRDDALPR